MLYPCFFLVFFLDGNDAYGKVWTDHAANITPGTLMAIIGTNCMIPFTVSLGGFSEDMLWTELDAETALLTPLYYHLNLIMF
jgi:hypothetical protein